MGTTIKTYLTTLTCVIIIIKIYGIYQLILTRNLPKPVTKVSFSLLQVFDGTQTQFSFHLFDQSNVSMLLSPTVNCDSKHVLVVPSAPHNTVLRTRLRSQFAGKAFLLFLLARTKYEGGDELLAAENAEHGDILQGNFPDSYSTLAYKTVMSFIWVNRFCSPKTKYIVKIDDDSEIDFEKLVSTLDEMDKDFNDKTISCPSVTRNRKVWRHREAKLLGKWAHSEAEIPGKYLPDYCNGFLYVISPVVGLALAETARIVGQSVYPTRNDEDYVVTGLLAERLPWIKHRSLTPVGGQVWDSFLSHCPVLDVLRYSFNPLAVGAGSGDAPELQYVKSPHFILCVFAEYARYQYFRPLGLDIDFTGGLCNRN